MTSAEYWELRAVELERQIERKADDLAKELATLYAEAEDEILQRIDAFYGKYAQDHGITIGLAKKRLSDSELRKYYTELAASAKDINSDEYKQHVDRLSGKGYLDRQEALLAQIRREIGRLGRQEHDAVTAGLADGVGDAASYVARGQLQLAGFDAGEIERMLKRPWMGETYSERIWRNKAKLAGEIGVLLPRAFAIGQSSTELGRELAKRMGVAQRHGITLARTEMNKACGDATLAMYIKLGVLEYKYRASEREQMCEVCGALHDKIFAVEDAQTGVNYHPMHPRCVCTTIPLVPEL